MNEFRVSDINSPLPDTTDSLDTHFREAVKNRQWYEAKRKENIAWASKEGSLG